MYGMHSVHTYTMIPCHHEYERNGNLDLFQNVKGEIKKTNLVIATFEGVLHDMLRVDALITSHIVFM